MTSDPTPQAKAGGRRRYLSGESELRIRSYGFSHRIYESMVLGMHPEFAYPRRSRVAPPKWCVSAAGVGARRYDSDVPNRYMYCSARSVRQGICLWRS